MRHHSSFKEFTHKREGDPGARVTAFSKHALQDYTEARIEPGDYLLFGRETMGLPPDIRNAYPCYKIPLWGKVRSLNLSTTVGIVVYHYLHKMGRFGTAC